MFHPGSSEQIQDSIKKAGSWRPTKELPPDSQKCQHEWEENGLASSIFCFFCGIATTERSRLHCSKCNLTSCALCALNHLNKRMTIRKVEDTQAQATEREIILLKELLKDKDKEFKQAMKDQATEFAAKLTAEQNTELKNEIRFMKLNKEMQDLRQTNLEQRLEIANIQKDYEAQLYHKNQQIIQMQSQIQKKEEELRDTKEELRCLQQVMTPPSLSWQNANWQDAQDPHSPQEDAPTQSLGMLIEDEVHQTIGAAHEEPKVRKVLNRLYNVIVEFEVPGVPVFRANAILDTGATTCCISKSIVPEKALETLTRVVYFNGVNSRQPSEHKIKQGSFVINGNKFPMPFIYALDMSITEGIQMLIGTNFTRSMNGGIRIEGNEVTIYKKITSLISPI